MNYIEIDNLTSQVPETVHTDPLMLEIYTVQAQAVDDWMTALWAALDEVFPLTATQPGLRRLEREAGIEPRNLADIARRRTVLVGRIRGEGTITAKVIQEIVEAYGYGTVEVQVYPNEFMVEITYADRLGLPPFIEDVEEEVLRKLPAHLEVTFVIRYLVWDALDARNLSWDALESFGLTWDQLEVWEG